MFTWDFRDYEDLLSWAYGNAVYRESKWHRRLLTSWRLESKDRQKEARISMIPLKARLEESTFLLLVLSS